MARQQQQQQGSLPSDLSELGGCIERWRSSRARRSAMPDELWLDATRLAYAHGLYRTSRALRVDYTSLKWRLSEARHAAGEGGSATGAAASGDATEHFVELDTGSLFGRAPAAHQAVVSVTDGAGRQLTVQLFRSADLDLPGLVAAFCGGRP